MQVFIMRHGEAADDAPSDSVRPLTLCGRDESRQMAAWLNTQLTGIDHVLVSPYLRAEQTLETVREALILPKGEEILLELTPCGDVEWVRDHLHTLAKSGQCEAVLVISHLPLVGYLVSALCPEEGPPMFATSAIANVTLSADNLRGTYEWQVSPSHLMAKVG